MKRKKKEVKLNNPKLNCFHKIIYAGTLLLALNFYSYAYKIELEIKDCPETAVYLGLHIGPDFEVLDTSFIKNGKATFNKNNKLHKGVYFIVVPPYSRFDILIQNTDTFSIRTTYNDLLNDLKITGEPEYQLFADMQKEISSINLLRSQLNIERDFYGKFQPDTLIFINNELKELDYKQFEIYSKYKRILDSNSFFYKILSILEPFKPDASIEELRYTNPEKHFEFYKKHYLDRIDFTEDFLIYTPEFIFHKLIEDYCFYFFDTRINNYQDVFYDIDYLISKTKDSQKINRYVLSYLISRYDKAKDVRLERFLVYIGKKYFLANSPLWLDPQAKAMIDFKLSSIQYNLIGDKAKDLTFEKSDGSKISIYELNSEYKILLFWEPDCDICNETVFVLLGQYQKIKENKAEILAVLTGENVEEWRDFVTEHDLPWVNAYDPKKNTGFQTYYGTFKTPRIYILNNENIILTKDIKPEKIVEFLVNDKIKSERNPFIYIFGQ
ncbi:MAG TPA: redoxin domain-containing protein [Bacteroidales bacterium]|nr:redoxin domain-containing protein [Bacteroidales bacterium]HRT80336.1 redoxin domain-containing protein [Bacteroidales bacterium]